MVTVSYGKKFRLESTFESGHSHGGLTTIWQWVPDRRRAETGRFCRHHERHSRPNIVWCGRLKELDSEDARKRPGGIVLRMTWKV